MAKELGFKQGEYKEAVDYFKQKINIPTKRWNSLKGAMHTRAFTIAGAMRADILLDFRNAVDKAISNGDSLQDFRDNFYKIASKWRESDPSFDEKMQKPKYGAWRSKVIYQTNMLTAAAAAQERQARELPDVFTHAKYVCMMLPGSREEHKQWNGTVLPVNDPWWEKHSPPNGFGCLCEKEFISKYEMKNGLEKETKAPTPANDTTNIGENWDYSIGDADAENQRLKEIEKDKVKKIADLYGKDFLKKDPKTITEYQKNAEDRHKRRTPEIIQNIRDRWNDRKDEKAGNIPKVTIDKKIDKFKKPQELFDYMEKKRGFSIDKKLIKYDFNKLKEVLKGIDSFIDYFPEAKIDELQSASRGKFIAAAKYQKGNPNSPFIIELYNKYFGKNSEPFKEKTPFHPKNNDAFSIVSHEMGHVVNYAMARMEGLKFYDHYEDLAKQIVNRAADNNGIDISDYNNVLKFRENISTYADRSYKYTETIAEAMSDVCRNRSRAAKESKAVYKSLMERMKNLRTNKRSN